MTLQPSRSEFVRARGLRHHLRRWGRPDLPMAILGHGFLDVSATFHHLVQPLLQVCQVVAPDWRGFGHSQWPQDGYWFPDYVADLDALVPQLQGDTQPLWLIGHSMGAQIVSLYAGLRPARVSKLVILDGLFLPDMTPELAPRRYTRWLDQWRELPRQKTYASFDVLAASIRRLHPRLPAGREDFIARCWAQEKSDGRIHLLADPKHRLDSPGLYRAAESKAIWSGITAETLFIDGGASPFIQAITAEELAQRRACFTRHREAQVADAGHMLHFDAAQETGERIARFLAQRN